MSFQQKRKVSKQSFEITIHEITNIKDNNDAIININWKRGKKLKGETKKVLVRNEKCVFEETITFNSTLFQNNMGGYKKKWLTIKINDSKRLLKDLHINLGEFVDYNQTKTFEVELYKQICEIKLTITSSVKKKSENDLYSESTTVTDMSEEDEELREDEFTDTYTKKPKKEEIITSIPLSSSLSNIISSINNTGEESDTISSLLSKREKRIKNSNSFGLDDDGATSLLTQISKISETQTEVKPKRKLIVKKNVNSETNDNTSKEDKIQKQLQEKKLLQQKLLEQEQEESEHNMMDLLINNVKPKFQNNIPISAPNLIKIIQEFKGFTSNTKLLSKTVRAIEVQLKNDISLLAYWLSNLCVILNLTEQLCPISNDKIKPKTLKGNF
jgi:hypothetical protein